MLFFLLWTAAAQVGSIGVASDMSQISRIMSSEMIPDVAKEMVQASLLGLQGTPEARQAIDTILGYLANLLVSVEQKHNATQTEIDTKVSAVEVQQKEVIYSIGNATIEDTEYVNCSWYEKLYKDLMDDTWENYTEWCIPNVQYACKDANLTIKANIPEETFTCSHADKNCQGNFDIFKGNIKIKNQTIHSNVRREVANWRTKWENCTKWSNITRDTKIEYDHYVIEHRKLVEKCLEERHVTVTGVCHVKTETETFCDKVGDYDVLKNQTEREGNIFSDPDRQQEWFAIKHAQCLLTQVLLNATIDHSKCDASYNFNLDYHVTTMTQMLEYWNCSSNTSVELNGTGVERGCPTGVDDCVSVVKDVTFIPDYEWPVKGAEADATCGGHCTGITMENAWRDQGNVSTSERRQAYWSWVRDENDGRLKVFDGSLGREPGALIECDGICEVRTTTQGRGYAHVKGVFDKTTESGSGSVVVMLDGVLDKELAIQTSQQEFDDTVHFEGGKELIVKFFHVNGAFLVAFNCFDESLADCSWPSTTPRDAQCANPWDA